MALSMGGRKGWDFSGYEDCLNFYGNNKSFPGKVFRYFLNYVF